LRFAGSARPGQKGDHKRFAEVKPRQVLRGRSAPVQRSPALPRQCIAQKQHFMRPRSTKPFFATGEVVLKPT
jgi:hypothetical protein